MECEKLISIIVITYNSRATILDTLDSINRQSYRNIELVISDDHSTDGTVEICNQWIAQHTSRFSYVRLLSIDCNTGVSANCNRGVKAVSLEAEWIKLIAGDDMLMPDCIENYIDFIDNHSDARVVFSDIISFMNDIKSGFIKSKPSRVQCKLGVSSLEYQLLYFKYFGQFTLSPTLFFHRSISEKVIFDERVPMVEDVAFNYNLLKNGIRIFYMPMNTVYYRIGDSISHQITCFFSQNFINSAQLYKEYYKIDIPKSFLGTLVSLKNYLAMIRFNFFVYVLHNKRNTFSNELFKLSNMLLNCFNKVLNYAFFKFVEDKW